MSKQYGIKWKHGDYVKLGRAVANFNKKRNDLYAKEKALYLPDVIDYNNLKNNIKSRNELNRQITALKQFLKEGQENPVILEGGEQLTKWEKKELDKMAKRIMKDLSEEESKIDKTKHPFPTQRELEIKAQKQNIKNYSAKKGYNFKLIKLRINNMGSLDYKYQQALRYRKYYMKEMEKYVNYQNYDLLLKKMESIKNPLEFYNHIKNHELISDLTYQSDEMYSQNRFNEFVEQWGIKIKNDEQYQEFNEEGQTRREFFRKERKGEFEEDL